MFLLMVYALDFSEISQVVHSLPGGCSTVSYFLSLIGALTELHEVLSHSAANAEKFRYRRARKCKRLSRNLSYKH